jgi:hypothetical protein
MDNKNFNFKSIISNNFSNTEIIPVVTYSNMSENKSLIYKENKGKYGVYSINNKITGKNYIGLSINLKRRFMIYYSESAMLTKLSTRTSIIYSSILKHGFNNFSLDILEYCEPYFCTSREQYYLDILKPKYNILKIANSRLGSKQSEETKKKMSISRGKPNNLPDTKIYKFSLKNTNIKVKIFYKSNNLLNEFATIYSAARYIGIAESTIRRIRKRGVSYDNYVYKFETKYNNHKTNILVYDYNKKLIDTFDSFGKVSERFKIPRTTLFRYIKSGKIYKNKIYFYLKTD